MLAKRIVACLDVKDGRVVKGRRFRSLRDAGDPLDCAMRYRDEGIDELVILDVSATLEERLASLRTVERVAEAIDVPVTVGGGVRGVEDFSRLLDAGADRVAVNSAAVANPGLIHEASQRYGRQCVVLSIDARRTRCAYAYAIRSGTQTLAGDAIAWAAHAEQLGAGEVLLTSIDSDGMKSGFDLTLISLCQARLGIPVVASGGAQDADSFADALLAGADAALGASVFHDRELSIGQVKQRCAQRGVLVRT
ncbi:MAG TPA: imidazole glycerol phosphate synthase subunit HisF [Candidatus Cybelea sp.]|jgi:imidazoleglycerol phosphate synthase cyclase subunit